MVEGTNFAVFTDQDLRVLAKMMWATFHLHIIRVSVARTSRMLQAKTCLLL